MKIVLPALLISVIMATSAAAHPHDEKREERERVGTATTVLAESIRESRSDRYRSRVYRGRGVRPERRCFEIREFDYNEGIVVSRYVCR
jgi:hypothetical protein